jgi:hypothetical protein
MLLGPIVWALHLTAVYGAHALLCARGSAAAGVPVIAVATLAALAPLGVAFAALWRAGEAESTQRFQRRVAVLLIVLSAVGIVWAGATVMFVAACAPLR